MAYSRRRKTNSRSRARSTYRSRTKRVYGNRKSRSPSRARARSPVQTVRIVLQSETAGPSMIGLKPAPAPRRSRF